MSGTREGGRKAAATNKAKHGDDFYRNIGRQGGSKSHPETRPFTKNPELASKAGKKGGQISKRGASKKPSQKRIKSTQSLEEEKKKGIFEWFLGRKNR